MSDFTLTFTLHDRMDFMQCALNPAVSVILWARGSVAHGPISRWRLHAMNVLAFSWRYHHQGTNACVYSTSSSL